MDDFFNNADKLVFSDQGIWFCAGEQKYGIEKRMDETLELIKKHLKPKHEIVYTGTISNNYINYRIFVLLLLEVGNITYRIENQLCVKQTENKIEIIPYSDTLDSLIVGFIKLRGHTYCITGDGWKIAFDDKLYFNLVLQEKVILPGDFVFYSERIYNFKKIIIEHKEELIISYYYNDAKKITRKFAAHELSSFVLFEHLIMLGLTCDGKWSRFLLFGLYDPRLLCLVWSFALDKVCNAVNVTNFK